MSMKEAIGRDVAIGDFPQVLNPSKNYQDLIEGKSQEIFEESGLDKLTVELRDLVREGCHTIIGRSHDVGDPDDFYHLEWEAGADSTRRHFAAVTISVFPFTDVIVFKGKREIAMAKVDWKERTTVENALAYTYSNPKTWTSSAGSFVLRGLMRRGQK